MERLTTRRRDDGRWALRNDDGANIKEQINKIPRAIVRLAAYEDIGLEPEDIDALQKRERGLAEMLANVSCGCAVTYTRLAELAQAEKDGRLVILPPNTPLTLDDLREMDGEPVWIERGWHPQAGWALVRVWSKAKNAIYLIYRNGNTEVPGCVLADGGKIYRRKPEEVDTCQKTSSLSG